MQSTAAGLWREWERTGVQRPQDYDSDVVEHLRRVLVRQGHDGAGQIALAMDRAGWSARHLLHALAPLIASFTGMQRDLLRLLQRVDARAGTKGNLRVHYEFVEGDVIDESLRDFRERVDRLERAVLRLRPLVFVTSHAFDTPLRAHVTTDAMEKLVAASGSASWETWPFAEGLPDPAPTGDSRVDNRADRVIALVRRVLDRLESVGTDTRAVREWMYAHQDEMREDRGLEQMISAATDCWPLSTAAAVYEWTVGIAAGTVVASAESLAAIDEWLEGFEADELEEVAVERAVEELRDVLSLPAWGKRHELYSAWVATQFDRALNSRLEFVITDGALRFPFRGTLLAHLPSLHGPVELWCEVRSPATGALHGGRARNIQPDYRFSRLEADALTERTTVAAVEVKQYKSPAPLKHGGTMHDYVMNLPGATVLLVAHGPLGDGILDAVPISDRARARVHPDVRIGRPREAAAFRAEIARLFPPPATRPTRIELRWSAAVSDLDLHVEDGEEATSYRRRESTHSALREDAFDGGPEIVDISPDVSCALTVRVNVYSAGTMREAAPVVTFFRGDDPVLALAFPEELALTDQRWWDVARIDEGGRMIPFTQSRELRLHDAAE